MINRLLNLWRLSEFSPEQSDELLNKEDLVLRRNIERKPKGQAKIIDMSEPIDLFPQQNETL